MILSQISVELPNYKKSNFAFDPIKFSRNFKDLEIVQTADQIIIVLNKMSDSLKVLSLEMGGGSSCQLHGHLLCCICNRVNGVMQLNLLTKEIKNFESTFC